MAFPNLSKTMSQSAILSKKISIILYQWAIIRANQGLLTISPKKIQVFFKNDVKNLNRCKPLIIKAPTAIYGNLGLPGDNLHPKNLSNFHN